MHSIALLGALAAIGTSVVSAATCTKDITITAATPMPTFDCDVIDAKVTVDEGVSGDLIINGPKQLKGDFIVNNATKLISLSSTSINAIGGTFELQNLEFLSRLDMGALRTINKIEFIKLPQLSSIKFGTSGATKVNSIRISDTFISDLSGLNVAAVENFQIDNNRKMIIWDSDLVNITGQLIINNNGNNMAVTMNQLEIASEIQISNVKSFKVPALMSVTESIKLDKNPELTSFSANNLTKITNDVSFINNKKLANISMPLLKSISGGFTIQNNTEIENIDGFPKLETVSGGIILRGDFEKVELPALKDVKGSVTVTSTTDISDFCEFFDGLKEDGAIQGDEKCTSNNTKANEGGNGGDSNDGSKSSDDDSEDAAGIINVNMALFGLVGVVVMAQLL
ncbi:Fc.00g099240.m01.CDS01 [Cosmosporella sp. VM-42]